MQTTRAATLVLPVALALGRAAASEVGDPIGGLSAEELRRFGEGRAAFEAVEGVADGLGPVFNGTSCAGCHDVGATGGGSAIVETRIGTITDGAFDPLVSVGGPLLQTSGIGAEGTCSFVGEVIPAEATIVARRRTTPLFGLGLVDAVPDTTLLALANDESHRDPSTAGRPNMVTDLTTGRVAVGRFGWKSQVPNLLQFSADAYLNEMGITTPLFPEENCPQGDCASLACDPVPGVDDDLEDVERFRDFMSFLAPPPRAGGSRRSTGSAIWGPTAAHRSGGRYSGSVGSDLFDQIGCASCHVRTLTTGASPAAALTGRRFRPYSDFLLHDMGSLGDGIEQGTARGGEMRTAPLWGLHLFTTYLHDGRTDTIEGAILAHDGQGRSARDRFAALPADQQEQLVAFLRTL